MKQVKYPFIHLFKDAKSEFYVLSNKSKRPNPLNAKFYPLNPIPTKYIGKVKRSNLSGFEKELLENWEALHGRPNKNMCYYPIAESMRKLRSGNTIQLEMPSEENHKTASTELVSSYKKEI